MAKNFNSLQVVEHYDHHIRQLIPGYELVHQQILALLKTYLNDEVKIAVVGCGTGYELNYLLDAFPQAKFIAIDPSLEMLKKAQELVSNRNDLARVEFYQADSSILKKYPDEIDAIVTVLVSHFIPLESKKLFFHDIYNSLKQHGICISYDLMQFQNDFEKLYLFNLVQQTGLNETQSQKMLERLDDDFELIGIQEIQEILKVIGFQKIQTFSQISNFIGLISTK